jgi:hypothetical protein
MADYGFSISVEGNILEQLTKIQTQLGQMATKSEETSTSIKKGFEGIGDSAKHLRNIIIEAFAFEKIIELGKQIFEATSKFEGFENRIKFSSIGAKDFTTNMEFLNETAKKLHLPKEELVNSFSEMQAGLVGTGIEGDKLRNLFTGISTAAATLHLPTEQLQRAMYDIKEIGEIGLNKRIERSLTVALPGIGNLVKQKFGKSMDEIQKEGMSGAEFLTKLGPALTENYGSGIKNFGNSLQGELNDAKNNILDTFLSLGEKLKPVFIDLLKTFNSAFDIILNLASKINFAAIYNTIKSIGEGVINFIMPLIKPIEKLFLSIWYGLKLIYETFTQFSGLGGNLISAIQQGLLTLIPIFQVLTEKASKFIAVVIDVLYTIYVIAEKIGLIWLLGKTFEVLYSVINAIGGFLYNIYNNIIKPIIDGIGYAYEKLKGILGIKDINVNATVKTNLAKTNTGEDLSNQKFQKPTTANNQNAQAAMNTSALSGASGGLGQAKVINITFKDAFQKITTTDNKQLPQKGEEAVELMIRAINNIAYNEGQTQ